MKVFPKANEANEPVGVVTVNPKDYRHSPNSTEVDAIDFLLSMTASQTRDLKKVIRKMQSLTYQSKVDCLLLLVQRMKGF